MGQGEGTADEEGIGFCSDPQTADLVHVIEKDGINNNYNDNDKEEPIKEKAEKKSKDGLEWVILFYQFKYFPVIFMLLMMFNWIPDVGIQDVLTTGMLALTISWLGNNLVG